MTIIERLNHKLTEQSSLSFSEFMQMALYDPEAGYYTSTISQFGQDFVTSPEISPLFAYCLAQFCQDILAHYHHPTLLEFGAGSGKLCVDLLTALEQLNCLPECYYILEVSATLKQLQHQTIHKAIPHLASRVVWLQSWPDQPFEGVVLANEVLDAMPVHRFMQTEDELYEIRVGLSKTGQFQDVLQVCADPRLKKQVQASLDPSLHPYQSEVNLFIDDWLLESSKMLKSGLMLIIDYGFPRQEYYHPDRYQGTLMCHYQHRAHPDPYVHIGLQDITAHVDFTHVAEAAQAAGFEVSGFCAQGAFLLENGLLSLLSAQNNEASSQMHAAVKTLVQPNEMGELFKVMALTKHWDKPLRGFQMQDRRGRL